MLLRSALSLALLLILVSPAAAERPFRVVSEDAYATQCRRGICATVQVTRSTFSNGNVQTILFFSAYDELGDPIPGASLLFIPIDSEQFVINKPGTTATLTYPGASVAWEATEDFSSIATSTNIVTQRTAVGVTRHRVTERAQQLGADAGGVVGPVVFDTGHIPENEGFGSAFVTIRKTISRTRLLDG